MTGLRYQSTLTEPTTNNGNAKYVTLLARGQSPLADVDFMLCYISGFGHKVRAIEQAESPDRKRRGLSLQS